MSREIPKGASQERRPLASTEARPFRVDHTGNQATPAWQRKNILDDIGKIDFTKQQIAEEDWLDIKELQQKIQRLTEDGTIFGELNNILVNYIDQFESDFLSVEDKSLLLKQIKELCRGIQSIVKEAGGTTRGQQFTLINLDDQPLNLAVGVLEGRDEKLDTHYLVLSKDLPKEAKLVQKYGTADEGYLIRTSQKTLEVIQNKLIDEILKSDIKRFEDLQKFLSLLRVLGEHLPFGRSAWIPIVSSLGTLLQNVKYSDFLDHKHKEKIVDLCVGIKESLKGLNSSGLDNVKEARYTKLTRGEQEAILKILKKKSQLVVIDLFSKDKEVQKWGGNDGFIILPLKMYQEFLTKEMT